MEETMIRFENVSKQYRLGMIGGTTLRAELQRLGARLRHKEDPTARIGQTDSGFRGMVKGDTFWALQDIDLSIARGETLGIIGKNGAGKSTLLKLLCRITAPTTGKISYNGRIASLLEVGTGFHPELTGRENIYLNGAILGMNRREINTKIDQIIEFSECRQFIDTPVKRYSSGMLVKLAFSVAAFLDAEIILMDEALAVGDAEFQRKCLRRMKELAEQEQRTILYVSHILPTVSELCDRCIVLDHGRITFDGETDDAISHYLENETVTGTVIDYTERKEIRTMKKHAIELTGATLENRTNTVFCDNEPVLLRLNFRYLEDCTDVSFRLELRTTEGHPVATSLKEQFLSGRAGEEQSALLQYDLSELMEGRYNMVFTFYQKLQGGNYVNLECREGHSFEKRFVRITELQWNASKWGNIRLAPPKRVE